MDYDDRTSPTPLREPLSFATVPAEPSQTAPLPRGRSPLPMLLFAVALVGTLFLGIPWLAGRVQYSLVHAEEQAKHDVAVEALKTLSMSDLREAFRQVPKVVGPSVVHINTTQMVGQRSDDEMRNLYGNRRHQTRGQGSGVIVDAEGYIVTNFHVIDGASEIEVVLSDQRRVVGRVIGADPLTDLAVVKIDADDLVASPWGDSDELEVGELVWAVGSPFGLAHSITFGIISAKGRSGLNGNIHQRFLQTDAAVNPGNSGGPLFNAEGRVVGINTAIVGPSYLGISFSIPSNMAREIYEKIREKGVVERGWLGVALNDLDEDAAKTLGLNNVQGALILKVFAGTPAAEADVRAGDVVVRWNDTEVSQSSDLSLAVAETEIGSIAKMVIVRSGQQQTIDVTVGVRPQTWQR